MAKVRDFFVFVLQTEFAQEAWVIKKESMMD